MFFDVVPFSAPFMDRGKVPQCPGTATKFKQCFGTMKRLFGLHRARYFGGCQNPRADGHGRHLAELAQGRKQDHLKQTNPSNRITQIRPLKSQRTGKHVYSNREAQKRHYADVFYIKRRYFYDQHKSLCTGTRALNRMSTLILAKQAKAARANQMRGGRRRPEALSVA
jgi:hypothetical protein